MIAASFVRSPPDAEVVVIEKIENAVDEHEPLKAARCSTVKTGLRQVQPVEESGGGAALAALGEDAGEVVHWHLPTGEHHEARLQLSV